MTPGQLQKLAFEHANTATKLRGEAERVPELARAPVLEAAHWHDEIAQAYITIANQRVKS